MIKYVFSSPFFSVCHDLPKRLQKWITEVYVASIASFFPDPHPKK